MSEHPHPVFERHCDVAVIGGSAAGLAAALQLGRQRRSVIVVQRGVRTVLQAVAPGGTLLVVGHDLEPMRRPVDVEHESRPFDGDAFVRVDDFAAVLDASPEWQVEVHENRPRPPGAASASHHVDDVVLRARRVG